MPTPTTKTAKLKAYAIAIGTPVAALWLLANIGLAATVVLGAVAAAGTVVLSGGFGNAWNGIKGLLSTLVSSTKTAVEDATVAAQKIDQTLTAKAAQADSKLAAAAAGKKFNSAAPAAAAPAAAAPTATPSAPAAK